MADYRSTGKELRKSPKGLIAGLLALVLAAGGCYGIHRVRSRMESLRRDGEESIGMTEISVPELETTKPAEHPDFTETDIPVAGIKTGSLILVNDTYLTDDNDTNIVRAYDKRNGYLSVRDLEVRLREDAMEAVNQLAAGFYKATEHSDLLLSAGYRTKAEQKKRYEKDAENNPVPGCSEYQTGYTFDFCIGDGKKYKDYTDEGDYAWIAEHCAEYGFVRRFPPDKEILTQPVGSNPWAFRYVGLPHSMFMQQNNMCLEEYLELVEEYPFDGTHLFEKDALGRSYEIYYVSVDPTETGETVSVPVPRTLRYTVSGNNKHGFIVTVEMPRDDQSWGSSASESDSGSAADETAPAETTTTAE